MKQKKPSSAHILFDEKLFLLKSEFWSRIPEKISAIEWLFNAACTRPAGQVVDSEFVRNVHSFVGAAGCMGFQELSRKAKELEHHLGSETNPNWDRKSFDDRTWSHIFALKQLARAARRPESHPTSTQRDTPSSLPTPMLNVLIASDDTYAREILSTMLRADGHRIIAVENGAQAVAAYCDERPDLILLDVIMPQMDGYEATQRIKQSQDNSFTPVVFVTSLSDRDVLLKCIECGGDDYILKPFDPDLVKARIFALDRIRRSKLSTVEHVQ